MAETERPLSITVKEHGATRSNSQNRLYWQRLNEIHEQAWIKGKRFSAEAWHEFFKTKFIGFEETPDDKQFGISTTTLSVSEFHDYMESVAAYAANELGVNLTA